MGSKDTMKNANGWKIPKALDKTSCKGDDKTVATSGLPLTPERLGTNGGLFVPNFEGETCDGHDFVAGAIRVNGASKLLCGKKGIQINLEGMAVIVADDPICRYADTCSLLFA